MGFLFLVLYPAAFSSSSSSRRRPHTPLTPPVISHTTCHHTTHTQLNSHTTCSHTCSHTTQLTQLAPISHIQLVIIQLAHIPHTPLTPPVITHTTCHHTTHTQLNSHTQLAHIQLNSRNLLTYHTYNLSSYNLLTSLTHHLLLPSSHIQLVIIQLDHIPHTPLTPPVITHTTCHHTTHTQLNSHTHNLLTYNSTHTTCSHTTQLTHNLLTYHTYNLSSYNLLTHNSTHTQLAHTYNLSSNNLLTHNLATSTFVSRGRRGTWSHPHSFHVAGVALTALGGLWWRTGFSADAVDAAALCVAGVALGDIHLHFAWQAWHLVTSTFVSRGRRGNYGTGRALVAHWVLS